MNKPAAIAAQLVDMRNVGTLKSLRLTIHVPQEEALKAIEAFGWPTGVNPVPVAIAMLNLKEVMPDQQSSNGIPETTPDPVAEAAPGRAIDKVMWSEKPLASQAAIRCTDPDYHRFLGWHMGTRRLPGIVPTDSISATKLLKGILGIRSRTEIIPGTDIAAHWGELEAEYNIWLRHRDTRT